jgi:hypothetical protein
MLGPVSAEQLEFNLPIVDVTHYIIPKCQHIITVLSIPSLIARPPCSQTEKIYCGRYRKIPKYTLRRLRKFSQLKLINEETWKKSLPSRESNAMRQLIALFCQLSKIR